MEKDDYIKNELFINSLNEDEQAKRNEYLWGLASGEIQGPPTGYNSFDKPHYKFYKKSQVNYPFEKKSAYQQLSERLKGNDVIFDFYGAKIRKKEFLKKITHLSNSFKKMGLVPGDVVSVLLPNIPEAYFIIYALNQIGVAVDLIDLRFKNGNIKKAINSTKPKIIVAFKDTLEELDIALKDYKIERLITVTAFESLPAPIKFWMQRKSSKYEMKNVPAEYIWNYNQFFANGNDDEIIPYYDFDKISFFEHTSGTSGEPKTVAMGDSTLTSLVNQYDNFEVDESKYKVVLNIIPPFMAYGLVGNGHFPLSFNMKQILIPVNDEDGFIDQLIKYKPSMALGTVVHWQKAINRIEKYENDEKELRECIHSISEKLSGNCTNKERLILIKKLIILKQSYARLVKKINSIDFSNLYCPGVGGDSIPIEFEKHANEVLKKYGCPSKICKGYGLTEVGSTFTSTREERNHGLGSVGIPFVRNEIRITREDGTEALTNEIGEIYLNSPGIMKGYLNNDEANKNALVNINGRVWFRTGDLGYVNGNGELFIKGRIKRMIITDGGNKAFPVEIENVLRSHPLVEDVCVVGVPDENRKCVVKAHIVLKNSQLTENEAIEVLKEFCKGKMKEQDEPVHYEIHEELPVTGNKKVDYNLLEKNDAEKHKIKEKVKK